MLNSENLAKLKKILNTLYLSEAPLTSFSFTTNASLGNQLGRAPILLTLATQLSAIPAHSDDFGPRGLGHKVLDT